MYFNYSSIKIIQLSFFLQLPPEEDVKRKQRRDRNKQAAAKCRRKRNDLRETLEKVRYPLSLTHTSSLNYFLIID